MPSGASSDETISRTIDSSVTQVSRLAVRMVPASVPVCGIALAATPALTAPHTMTVLLRGSMRRDSTPGTPGDQRAQPVDQVAGQVRSRRVPAVRLQRDLDLIGRRRDRARPGSRPCRPPAAGRSAARRCATPRVSAPAAIASIAPPGISSSAAWKISRTPTGSSGTEASASAVPSRIAVCASCPHACVTFGHHRRVRRAGALGHRQRIHVGPQRDPRPVLGAEVAGQPGAAGQHLRVEARVGQVRGDELRGGELLTPQLGVRVDVPAPGDQVVVVRGQPGLGGVGEAHDAARLACSSQHPVPLGRRLGQADDRARQHDRALDDGLVGAGPGGRRGERRLVDGRAVGVDADDRVDAGHHLRDVAHVGAAQRQRRLDVGGHRAAAQPHHLGAEGVGQPRVGRQLVRSAARSRSTV